MAGTTIYGILAVIATAMVFMATWRLLFLGSHKEADPMAIDALVARCKRGEPLAIRGKLGWLEPFIVAASGEFVMLRRSIEDFRQRTERFHSTLVVAANAAMGVGFLGTVVSMASTVAGNVDPVMIISLGMQTTMIGLMVALPGTVLHGLTDNKVMRFLDQIDAVLKAVDGRINPPPLSAVFPPNGDPLFPNGSNENGRNGSHQTVKPHAGIADEVPGDGESETPDETDDHEADDDQRKAVAMIASSSDFDEMVMNALEDGDIANG